MPALTVRCLNSKENISAIALTMYSNKYQQETNNLIVLSKSKRNPLKWLWYKLTLKRKIKNWIKWADVIHYTWTPVFKNGADVKYAFKKKKALYVEWIGSDVRNPEYLKTINPYYKAVFDNGYEYAAFESKEQSLKNQKLFAKYGAIPLACPEIKLYIEKSLFRNVHLVYQRINLNDFVPSFPKVSNQRPLIVHSPTAKTAKGSNIIVPLVEHLKEEYNFDFVLLNDMSREEVLQIMNDADIFLDQIIGGSYGMASMEAMSFGKPVMCYIMPEVFEAGLSHECPIVNANPDNLKEQLIKLITNPQLRHDIGIKSRAFAEKFHDVEKVSSQLLTIYKTELAKQHDA